MSIPLLKTNQQLLAISKYKPNTEEFTEDYAGLSDDDKLRWERLYNYNQNRAKGLTRNGIRYSDADKYNEVIDEININRKDFIQNSFDKAWKVPTSKWLKDRRDQIIRTMQGEAPRDANNDNVITSKEARNHYRNLKRGYKQIYTHNRMAAPEDRINISNFHVATKPLEKYKGPNALTDEELKSNTFNKKNGGQLKYYKPKK